jgi:sortase B
MVYNGAGNSSLLKYKPGSTGEAEEGELLDSYVAWLTLNDTSIDYPVMQGIDNVEFLNKDPFGNYSLSGSLFLDSRCSSDFSDSYNLIYGHHMEYGVMFGALDKFLDESYFDSHDFGNLVVGDCTYLFSIFAVVESDAANMVVFSPTEVDVGEVIGYITENAVFYREGIYTEDSLLLGLSTCKYPDTTDRILVYGTLELVD